MVSGGDMTRELVLDPLERKWRFDIAHLPSQLLIEMDGYQFHRQLESFKNDRRKQTYALTKNWVVLRVGTEDIIKHYPALLDDIKAIIALRPVFMTEIVPYGKNYCQVSLKA